MPCSQAELDAQHLELADKDLMYRVAKPCNGGGHSNPTGEMRGLHQVKLPMKRTAHPQD